MTEEGEADKMPEFKEEAPDINGLGYDEAKVERGLKPATEEDEAGEGSFRLGSV
jgi:hypothetical protein